MSGAKHPAFEAAARISAVSVLGQRGLGRVHGGRLVRGKGSPCPWCAKDNGAFSAFKSGFRLKCHSCGAGGDAIALVRELDGVSALDAARIILGYPVGGASDPADWKRFSTPESNYARRDAGPARPSLAANPHKEKTTCASEVKPRPKGLAALPQCGAFRYTPFGWQAEADLLARISTRKEDAQAARYLSWRAGIMAHGVFAKSATTIRLRAWYSARYLDPALLGDTLDHLIDSDAMVFGYAGRGDVPAGMHKLVAVINGRRETLLVSAAMLARIEAAPGTKGSGLHATYLAPDGLRKVSVPGKPARKMWAGPDGARGGVWLTAKDRALGPLFVAEGIESALSALMEYRLRHPGKGRALAVLSLNNFQGGIARDIYGRHKLWPLESDPAQPPVTWPNMGDVIICPDHDMAEITVKTFGGKVVLNATDRMEISAKLAMAGWRAAGARTVRKLCPPLGMDMNDARRRVALGYFETGVAA